MERLIALPHSLATEPEPHYASTVWGTESPLLAELHRVVARADHDLAVSRDQSDREARLEPIPENRRSPTPAASARARPPLVGTSPGDVRIFPDAQTAAP